MIGSAAAPCACARLTLAGGVGGREASLSRAKSLCGCLDRLVRQESLNRPSSQGACQDCRCAMISTARNMRRAPPPPACHARWRDARWRGWADKQGAAGGGRTGGEQRGA